MEIKIFISYSSDDNNKKNILKNKLNEVKEFIPVVIADRRRNMEPLTAKVESGLKESQIIIPIITRKSINTQWINQEIGYTKAISNIRIVPLVEDSIINDLKGFIHKQVDISNAFKGFPENNRREGIHFGRCIRKLIEDLKDDYNLNPKPEVSPELIHKDFTDDIVKYDKKIFYKIYDVNKQLKSTFYPYIVNKTGSLFIWAKVKDHHNKPRENRKELYIISTYTDDYKTTKAPSRYPDM